MWARVGMAGGENYSFLMWTTENPAFWWSEGTINGDENDWYQVSDTYDGYYYVQTNVKNFTIEYPGGGLGVGYYDTERVKNPPNKKKPKR
jgi:hypothetical protein